jgi:thiol-disulfide isomerase/thioredoxin
MTEHKTTKLRFYTRENCSLCEKIYPALQRLQREGLADVERVDIDESTELRERYGWRIPVVEFPDGQLLEGRISEWRLRRRLTGAVDG